jgi:hypothetical protein
VVRDEAPHAAHRISAGPIHWESNSECPP